MAKTLLPEQELHAIAARVDALVHQLAASADPHVREQAQELVRLVMQMYGSALGRILVLLDRDTLNGLLADDLIASLLVLHDLHPDSVHTRVARGLARVATLTGVDITVLNAEDAAVSVQVSAVDALRAVTGAELKRLIEGAVQAAAPDVSVIDIRGLPVDEVPLIQLTRNPLPPRETPISVT